MRFSFFIILLACFHSLPGWSENQQSLKVNLLISVDWEGYSLEDHNIQAFNRFRDDYPEIKIIHFLNAAYFTKPEIDSAEVATKIKSVLRPGDELGLHIHALESLLNTSGVSFHDGMTFWGDSHSHVINGERGHDIPLSLFSVTEMRKLIRTSLDILNKNGFNNIDTFRAGGWIATPAVLEALAIEGIHIDSSAVPSDILSLVAGESQPLYQINKDLWPDQTPYKVHPYLIQTGGGPVLEFPDNAALADYISGEQTFQLFDNLISQEFGNLKETNFQYGFHQETAASFLPRVRVFLEKIKKYTQTYRVEVLSRTFAEFGSQRKLP